MSTRIPRSRVKVGDLVHSSHGYDLRVTEVIPRGTEGQTTEIRGWVHGKIGGTLQHEIYDSTVGIDLIEAGPDAHVMSTEQTVLLGLRAAPQVLSTSGYEFVPDRLEIKRSMPPHAVTEIVTVEAYSPVYRALWGHLDYGPDSTALTAMPDWIKILVADAMPSVVPLLQADA